MVTPLLRSLLFSIFTLSILQSSNAVEPSPVKTKTGGGGTATPAASPEKKPLPPGAIDEKLFSGMQWRQIGPFRGGRALAIEGGAGEPGKGDFGGVAGRVLEKNERGPKRAAPFCKG